MLPIDQSPQYTNIIESISQSSAKTAVSGLWGSGKAYLISALYQKLGRPILVITSDEDAADTMTTDLQFFLNREILQFPSWEILPYEDTDPLVDLIAERMLVFQKIQSSSKSLISNLKSQI